MTPGQRRIIRYLAEAGMATTHVVVERGFDRRELEGLEGLGFVERVPRRGQVWRGFDVWRLSARGRALAA